MGCTAPRRLVLGGLILASLAGPVRGADTATGTFTATAVADTPEGTRRIGVTIVVSRPEAVEQALPLRKVLETGGQQALLAAIRGGNRGQLRLGAVEYPIDLVIAEAAKYGFRYITVSGRNLQWQEVNEGSESLDYPFAVAVFEVPGIGTGEGKIFPRAALSIGEDGKIVLKEFEGRSGVLKDIKRQ